ncbi:MAG: glycoside hydrolase family 3 C-terminal domain-containing protein [Lachnospiraceae bacterium]|nr:glycoside hydrolase family 3 C-terminal domain-containing protein [Lachnospiraceae bacterium]
MNKNAIEMKIQALLVKMTLEEKVGQLQQCGPSLVGAFEVSFEELLDMMFDGRISKEEFDRLMGGAKQDFHEEDIRAGRIGSFNGIGDAATANRLQKIAVEETRLGIPLIYGYDVIHGFRTVTPIPLAESCAWEPELWERTGRLAAQEATAAGVHMTFAPMVDVAKDARWGRVSEGAGEDVLLNGDYGAAKVRGFQGDDLTKEDAMAACVKHFAAYGAGEAGRDYNRVDMSLQKLWDEYLPSYKACIDAGARAVMPAFNDINGVPCSANEWLLRDVLRKDWGYDGMTISDANAIAECVNHGIAADQRDAAKQCLRAGVDMDMTSNSYIAYVQELIENGELDESVLDESVANILRVKFELGLFDQPYRTSEEREAGAMLTEEARKLAREAAVKSMVLLKNESMRSQISELVPETEKICADLPAQKSEEKKVLPLAPDTKPGIFGRLAGDRGEMTGAWAIGAHPEDCRSIVDACKMRGVHYQYLDPELCAEVESEQTPEDTLLGHASFQVAHSIEKSDRKQKIRETAEKSDVLIAAIGENKDESGEAASRASITLKDSDICLIEELLEVGKAQGKPVIVVLFNGRPLAIPELAEKADAILEAWHPGVEAGPAILDVLYGDVNPSGKLTTTFPYTSGQCPMYYAHTNTGRPGGKSKFTSKYLDTPLEPVYPFGYGLSYTTYEYDNLSVEKITEKVTMETMKESSGEWKGYFHTAVTVKNTGDRAGEEIVQCYVRDVVGSRVRPLKELKGYQKIHLEPGEEKLVEFVLPFEKLGFYNRDLEYVTEPGEFRIYVGGNSREVLEASVVL